MERMQIVLRPDLDQCSQPTVAGEPWLAKPVCVIRVLNSKV